MNILMVLPRVFVNISEPEHFPVGMAYVTSCLKKEGHNVTVINLNFISGDVKRILEKSIKKHRIEIVETGGLVTHYWMVKEIVDSVKEIDPHIYTLVGGGIVTGDPELLMDALPTVDFGVFGEGEITNNDVSLAIEGKKRFREVNGLIYRERIEKGDFLNIQKSNYIKNPPREEICDLDRLPRPDYEAFQLDKMLEYAPKKYVTMSTGRSCIFRCTFCFHTSGQKYRQRSLDSFFSELDFLVERYGIDNIYITDELFANDFERLKEFCNRISKYNILWSIQLRVNIVTRELLLLLKNNGCIIISFGLESADNRVLKSMRKGITVEMIEKALELSFEVGIEVHGSFIFGDIAENQESIHNTLEWWENHRHYNINLALIQVYPGTYLYKYACDKGIIKDKIAFLEQGCPYVNVSQLTDKEYIELGRRLIKESTESFDDIKEELTIEKFQKNRVNITYRCPNCHSIVSANRCSTATPTTTKCCTCGSKYVFNPFLYYKNNVEKNLKKIYSKAKNVVVWDPGAVFSAIYRATDKMLGNNFEIISRNNTLWGMEYYSHKIKDESILKMEKYDSILMCDFFDTYYTNYINTRYKGKKIYSSGNLVDP